MVKKSLENVELNAMLVDETDEARLVELESGERFWIPKSHSYFDDNLLGMPEWLALEKGMI